MTMKHLLIDLAIMLIGSSAVALIVCKLYLRDRQRILRQAYGQSQAGEQSENDLEYPKEMVIISTPHKKDKYVIRSKEIEAEEQS